MKDTKKTPRVLAERYPTMMQSSDMVLHEMHESVDDQHRCLIHYLHTKPFLGEVEKHPTNRHTSERGLKIQNQKKNPSVSY